MQDEEIPNLEEALSSLAEGFLEEESSLSQHDSKNNPPIKGAAESAKIPPSKIDNLRSQERTLLRIDRLLISGGVRFVLFLPFILLL